MRTKAAGEMTGTAPSPSRLSNVTPAARVGQGLALRRPLRPSRALHTPRGGALLAVLWLSAALSAIAFSVATTIRAETDRAATTVDTLRAYYLATGAIERALLYMEWAPFATEPDGRSRYYNRDTPRLQFDFPEGVATVDVIPEGSKINVNSATAEELFRLVVALGAEPERARDISLAIIDWRTARPPEAPPSEFDAYYLGLVPSFRAQHASFQEIEEVLHVKGMTPELFYGSYARDEEGRLAARPGFRDCATVYGGGAMNVNAVQPAALAAIGIPPETIAAILEARRHDFIRDDQQLAAIGQGAPGFERLSTASGSIVTLRATARLRRQDGGVSPEGRSVAAVVKLGPRPSAERYHVLRWYDNAWVQ